MKPSAQQLRQQLDNLANAAAIVWGQFNPPEDSTGASGRALLGAELEKVRRMFEHEPRPPFLTRHDG